MLPVGVGGGGSIETLPFPPIHDSYPRRCDPETPIGANGGASIEVTRWNMWIPTSRSVRKIGHVMHSSVKASLKPIRPMFRGSPRYI